MNRINNNKIENHKNNSNFLSVDHNSYAANENFISSEGKPHIAD